MALVLSRSAFKRLCLLPLLLVFLIIFFYHQIANIYRNVEYQGNMTVVQMAFDLFKRQPVDICRNVVLLNVGDPKGVELNSYPQSICADLGFQIEENNCVVYVIKTQKNEWSLEDTVERIGCRVYSLLLASDSTEVTPRNRSNYVHFHSLGEQESIGKFIQKQSTNATLIDYMMIRLGRGGNEWRILSDLMESHQLDRVKHLSVGINLCPDRSSFTESHFQYVLDTDRQLVDKWDMKLFDVANDQETFVYNPVVKEKTHCASQFAWINQRFHQLNDPQFKMSLNDSQATESVSSQLNNR